MSIIYSRILVTLTLAFTSLGCTILEDEPPTIDAQSNFDLSEYLFPDRILTSGEQIVTTETLYRKSNVEQIASQEEYVYSNNNGTIRITDSKTNAAIAQIVITANSIEEQRASSSDIRRFQRVVRLGDTYLDSTDSNQLINETCVLLEYFDTYNLASATGATPISRDTHNNVIKARCESNFLEVNNRRNNFRWNLYYAKGVGLVFKDGNWTENMGLIYGFYRY